MHASCNTFIKFNIMSKIYCVPLLLGAIFLYGQGRTTVIDSTSIPASHSAIDLSHDKILPDGQTKTTTPTDSVFSKLSSGPTVEGIIRELNNYLQAPNSYIFYKDGLLPDGTVADGLFIPVAKAYQMWQKGRFMQNEAGTYTPINPNADLSASVYWEDVNGLISSTEITGTGDRAKIKVLIDKTKGEGNAVIAFRVNGEVYWTWHIWVTDDPQYGATYAQGFETNSSNQLFTPQYMDRNLGATNASFLGHDWHKSGGLMYQWGRKDAFPPLMYKDGSFYEVTGDVTSRRHSYATLQTSAINVRQRGSETSTNQINGNIRFAIRNPLDIISHATNDGIWFSDQEYKVNSTSSDLRETWDLWSDNRKGLNSNASSSNASLAADSKSYEIKSEFDPCPNGWRVPSHYGRNTVNNNLNPLGRRNSGVNDDTNPAFSQILPNSENAALLGVKVYPGRGMDFNGTSARKIGLIPTTGNYVYYPPAGASPAKVVYQDQATDGLMLTATYGIGGYRGTLTHNDAERTDVASTGWNGIYVNQIFKTNGLGALRCMRDPNLNLLPAVYETEFIPSADAYNTDYQSWTKEPNSFVVMTGEASENVVQDTELLISLKKAYAMHKLYLSDNHELPAGNLNTGTVVWSDNPQLIKKIEIVGSFPDEQLKVRITAGQKGNAVVAFHKGNNGVFNSNNPDKILWSWHIWAPVTDPLNAENQVTYITESLENGGIIPTTNSQIINPAKGGTPLSTTFMDRNLGALDALPSALNRTNPVAERLSKTQIQRSGGLHYQWGRKDPLPTFHNPGGTQYIAAHSNSIQVAAEYSVYRQTGVDAENNVIMGIDTPITDANFSSTDSAAGYSREWNVYKNSAGVTATDSKNDKIRKVIRYAAENPLSYLFRNRTGAELGMEDAGTLQSKAIQVKDWISDENGQAQDRWGHATEKSVYDPCPVGWRVPDTATAALFAAGDNGSYAKGSSPWFYNGYNTNSSFANYGIVQSAVADLTGAAANNAVNTRQYPGYTLSITTDGAPSSRTGWVFDFQGSKYNIGNVPASGIRGILGGNDWKDLRSDYPLADNYKYQTGLWTSSPADFYTGYAIGLSLSSVSGNGGKLASGTGFYPQAAMGVRCARDTERYMGDLPYLEISDATVVHKLAVAKNTITNQPTVYPNPVRDTLHIQFQSDDNQKINYQITDISGKVLRQGKISANKISFSGLPHGVYMLKLENQPAAIKIIKK